ncbi:ATP-binding protein [Thalassococcus sp. BH17M4-6]|uniref:ATP-binding protein n=1 Tax=Thalassococcus sp. BH17M4-6 TaxID=3413148 RepID=UPI003BE0DCB8
MDNLQAPYATSDDWLRDAATVFAGRIGDHLAPATTSEDVRLVGLVETREARALAEAIANGAPRPPQDPPARQALAQRLGGPAALADLPVAQMMIGLGLGPNWAVPLALMAVVAADARFARLLAWLNDDVQRRHLTAALVQTLCGPDAPDPRDWAASPLTRLNCLEPQTQSAQLPGDRAVILSAPVLRFLQGLPPDDPALAGLLLPARTLPLDQLLNSAPKAPHGPFAVLGAAGAGRRAVAAALLLARGMPAQVLKVGPGLGQEVLACALRDCALTGEALILSDAHAMPVETLRWCLQAAPGPLALTAEDRLPLDLPQIRVPDLDAQRTARLWTARLGPDRAEDAGQLAHQFRLPVDDILSVPAGPERPLATIRQACLDRSAGTLSRLATHVPCRHDWDDLVLPPRQTTALRAIVSRARHARAVFEDWGFGRKLVPNRGLSALFSGPSGAGKTLSASVVARAIGLPLYRVDLSATVSKYIGETEKNLEQIFTAAESANACLLFDECDALFGKRSEVSDAHDRYANIETSYLLQRMEAHRGIVMMSSNHPQNIDEAFMRRIDIAIEYALPDAALRMALWQRLMPPEAAAEIDAVRLGERFELTGGSIRNCLVTAAFLASEAGERITTDHCVRAVALEYEKTRRPLTRAEFGDAYPALRARKGA